MCLSWQERRGMRNHEAPDPIHANRRHHYRSYRQPKTSVILWLHHACAWPVRGSCLVSAPHQSPNFQEVFMFPNASRKHKNLSLDNG